MNNFLTRDTSSKQLFGSGFDVEAITYTISSFYLNGVISNVRIELVTIDNSTINGTVIGNISPADGTFTNLTVTENTNLNQNVTIGGSLIVDNCAQLGNIKICENDITSVNSNGNINIDPDGNGIVNVYGPINNVISSGNFNVETLSGGASITTTDDIQFTSESGGISLTSPNGNIDLDAPSTNVLGNLNINNNLILSFERYDINSSLLTVQRPSTEKVITLFSVTGVGFAPETTEVMPVGPSIPDGTFKIIVCSSMGTNCSYTIRFASGTLITPNPLNPSSIPTKIVFKRRSQSVQIMYDAVQQAWILLTSGGYIM